MIVHYSGSSRVRLPADIYPAIFGYSLNRKLRADYTGEYFKFRHSGASTGVYPRDTPDLSGDVYIEAIYDQKVRHGVDVQNLVQLSTELQPRLTHENGYYRAVFDDKEYMEALNLAHLIGQDFTITCLGDSPRSTPMIGIWGTDSEVTIEPAQTSRLVFDNGMGAMLPSVQHSPKGYYSGLSKGKRIISVTSTTKAEVSRDSSIPAFTNLSIGRSNNRRFKGQFTEATMHLGDITDLGRKQVLESTINHYS